MYCKYLQAYDMILWYFGNNFLYKRTSVNADILEINARNGW